MKTKQEILMDLFKNFTELDEKDQMYVSGIVQGMFLQKTKNTKNVQVQAN